MRPLIVLMAVFSLTGEVSLRYPTDVTSMQVDGLSPGGTYSLRADINLASLRYESEVAFTASAHGGIDTATDKPISGTYAVIDPEGMFWSMVAKGATTEPANLYRF